MPPPTAATISIVQTLALLDGPFRETAEAVAAARYAFWLGSGISFDRMPRLKLIARKVLDYLQKQTNAADPNCRFGVTLKAILNHASLSTADWAKVDLARPVDQWPHIDDIADRLVQQYARMLDEPLEGEEPDFLLWKALDVVGIYANPSLEPDAEHLCIAALILEGVASNIASANWDGLIEKAVDQLSGGASILRVCVRPEETRADELVATLYKFHGCAVLAGKYPAMYRDRIVGRASQINGWVSKTENHVVGEKLIDLVTTKPTLMIGLSAQDSNIQGIFVAAQNRMPWPWPSPSQPPACVFSEEALGPDQRGLLQNVYRAAYTAATRNAIDTSALLRAYAKPLLAALWFHIVTAKLHALLERGTTALSAADHDALRGGVVGLRNLIANGCPPGGYEPFIRAALGHAHRMMTLFREGHEPPAGIVRYSPISSTPLQKLITDPSLNATGLCELAVALGLIGMNGNTGDWKIHVGAPGNLKSGALQIEAAAGTAEVFFAANNQSAVRLFVNGHVANNDDAIVIHSLEISRTATRYSKTAPGRTGKVRVREVSVTDLLMGTVDANDLLQRFRQKVAL